MRRLSCARPLLWIALLALLLSGCASRVTLTPIDPTKRTLEAAQNALNSGKVSESTLLFLEERDLYKAWKSDPLPVLVQLFGASRSWIKAKDLLSLTELCFYQAGLSQKPELKARLYLTTALLAYQALFHTKCDFLAGPYQPERYIVSQYYNRSLAKYIIAFRDGRGKLAHGAQLDLLDGTLQIVGKSSAFTWPPEEVERFVVSSEFKIKGLKRESSETGVGAPVVFQLKSGRYVLNGEGKKAESDADPDANQNAEIAKKVEDQTGKEKAAKRAFVRASTVILRFSKPLDQADGPRYTAMLELYDPLKTNEYQDGESTAPLASDYSTAIALVLSRAPNVNPLMALLAPDAWEQLQGLIMMQPYQRGKIPVVFVHGLMSSPLTWASMLNRLMTDVTLRQRCQIWFYGYPTSNPVAYSAADFRDALQDARKRWDPDASDPAFEKMVIVGHSMGGLLARSMVMHSDVKTWKEKTGVQQLESDALPQEARELLLRMIQYEPLPFVSRIVFLATPHRGASMADSTLGQLGASLITLPFKLMSAATLVFKNLAQFGQQKGLRIGDRLITGMPTGIDSLSPENPMLLWGAEEMEKSKIPFHSIIGNLKAANVQGGEDGIVPYTSSHLANARSEIVVRSDHSVQEKAPTVAEVRRILLEHIGAAECLR
jgi:pimeloyl-ACP methyl ester carboxylesterase